MISKEKFDTYIKKNLAAKVGADSFGYVLSKTYDNYYSKQAFSEFIMEMQSEKYLPFYNNYSKGKGDELEEKAGRYGTMPPKMASVASSSRLCYLALRDGAKGLGSNTTVEFEHECRINGISGTAPQMDAFLPNENIYVEVKCHEIFDSHQVILKSKYWDHIFGTDNAFGFIPAKKNTEEKFQIELSEFGLTKKSSMFDIKQFLCHLMGIASRKDISKRAKLIYLFFKPKMKEPEEQEEIDEVFHELQKEISCIFKSKPIQNFVSQYNIQLAAMAEYAPVMEPLTSTNQIELFPS